MDGWVMIDDGQVGESRNNQDSVNPLNFWCMDLLGPKKGPWKGDFWNPCQKRVLQGLLMVRIDQFSFVDLWTRDELEFTV